MLRETWQRRRLVDMGKRGGEEARGGEGMRRKSDVGSKGGGRRKPALGRSRVPMHQIESSLQAFVLMKIESALKAFDGRFFPKLSCHGCRVEDLSLCQCPRFLSFEGALMTGKLEPSCMDVFTRLRFLYVIKHPVLRHVCACSVL
jgi:hypothetical protein